MKKVRPDFRRLSMLVKTGIKLEPSLDEKGWSVRLGESHWRFGKYEFARQFAERMSKDDFAEIILEHAHNHIWESCRPEECRGALWQIIQGIE